MARPFAAKPEVSIEVSIIVPARNEEACLRDCLDSLAAQDEVTFEIIVVDDGSTDATRAIAESVSGVRVISAGPLPAGWTGKNNALVTGVAASQGEWLLFTDADTVQTAGSLGRALAEAKANGAELLSYSPEQVAVTFWEMAILPVVFAELAREYPPAKVSDPASPIAAANGQYILVRRSAYEAIGGHARVATSLLEDVALARAFKTAGRKVRFRYAADAVRTRMYRNFAQLREGWTKNLALLFPSPGKRAVLLGLWWMASPCVIPLVALYYRVRRANFGAAKSLLATVFGPPLFAYLVMRSKRAHAAGSVEWKGRAYADVIAAAPASCEELGRRLTA